MKGLLVTMVAFAVGLAVPALAGEQETEKTATPEQLQQAYSRCLQSAQVQIKAIIADYVTNPNRPSDPVADDFYIHNKLKPIIDQAKREAFSTCQDHPFTVFQARPQQRETPRDRTHPPDWWMPGLRP
jgi:hypothetical protein